MAEAFKDYHTVERVEELRGVEHLSVLLKTKEFGDMVSSRVKSPGSQDLIGRIYDSLAYDLIDEYEDRLKFRARG